MGGGCYKISEERMGWIEAKKMCEATNSLLISFQSPEEADSLISFIRRIQVFLVFFAFLAVFWPNDYMNFLFFSASKNQI